MQTEHFVFLSVEMKHHFANIVAFASPLNNKRGIQLKKLLIWFKINFRARKGKVFL